MNYHLSRHEINKRCAELLGCYYDYENMVLSSMHLGESSVIFNVKTFTPNYCQSWQDAEPIIEKCWSKLIQIFEVDKNELGIKHLAYWQILMANHQCTQLEAACICFIEQYTSTEAPVSDSKP